MVALISLRRLAMLFVMTWAATSAKKSRLYSARMPEVAPASAENVHAVVATVEMAIDADRKLTS